MTWEYGALPLMSLFTVVLGAYLLVDTLDKSKSLSVRVWLVQASNANPG